MPHDRTALERAAATLGIDLSPGEVRDLLAYLDAMLEENQNINLTGIRDPSQALVLHVLDSLAVRLLPLEFTRAVDLGTGNGFPGVALGVCWPDAETTLLDRTEKKVRAIAQALRRGAERAGPESTLHKIRTVAADALHAVSQAPELADRCDLVTARAFGRPEDVARLAEPLCAIEGQLLLWVGPGATVTQQLPGPFELQAEVAYKLPEPAPRQHRLALYQLVG